MKTRVALISFGFVFSSAAFSMTLVGSNATAPFDKIQLVSDSGTVLNVIGPAGASAAAADAGGSRLFFALPGDTSTTIQEYDAGMNLINAFVFTAPSDLRDFSSDIVDLGWGMSSLWASTFTGVVYQLLPSGFVQSSFDTGDSSPGITTDGTFLYTTEGLAGPNNASPFIYRRDTAGNILNAINTGLNDTLGIGVAANGTFWIGGFDVLVHVNAEGNVLQQFSLDGEHTGVEVVVPEPGTVWLAALASLALLLLGKTGNHSGIL
jgi:hypothetical protein